MNQGRSTSFGATADVYEAGRPEYPASAVDWLVTPGKGLRVADVGAGTGKLTRAIAAAGHDVVAVDPDPDMLKVLRDNVTGVPTLVGTAESLPLADSSSTWSSWLRRGTGWNRLLVVVKLVVSCHRAAHSGSSGTFVT